MVEFWKSGGSEATTSMEAAREIEAEGWDGQMYMDSQCLTADPYIRMGIWVAATKRLKVCTGVTNPLTRHPAVTASCAATLQSISGGRAVLGIGRGDSALAYLGYAPASLTSFRQSLEDMQTLLGGGEIPFKAHGSISGAPLLDTMSLGNRPKSIRLQWLPPGMPKVPLNVAATGPKVIELSAQIAEQITFSVGAIPERMNWALDLARAARKKKGLGDKGISYGAQIIMVCHPDVESIKQIATNMVAPLARFQVIQGAAAGPKSGSDEENFEAIRKGYDMTKHAMAHADDKIKGGSISWDFVRRFAIVGPPDHCVERLLELARLGIERFVIVGTGYYPEADKNGPSLFVKEVMPAVRAALRK